MSASVQPPPHTHVLLAALQPELIERALVAEAPLQRDRLVAPAADEGDALAAEPGEVANRRQRSADAVGGDETSARPDQARVDRDAGEVGRRQLGQLRLLRHEGGENDPLGAVRAAEIVVVSRLTGDLAGQPGEQEYVELARVGMGADTGEDVVQGVVAPAPTR